MATKWDDGDDVVRPSVQSPKDVRGAVDDWQSKMKADAANAAQDRALYAATAPPPSAEPTSDAQRATAASQVTKREVKAPPPPSEAAIKKLREQARWSADDATKRTRTTSKRVRLRVRVSGWYEGSVPAVDFVDGKPHFFPHAPTQALDSEEHYLEYWRKPFIERFRELGFEVDELDIKK